MYFSRKELWFFWPRMKSFQKAPNENFSFLINGNYGAKTKNLQNTANILKFF